MIEPRMPKYDWGLQVKNLADLYNDGTFPNAPPEGLLVAAGTAGEIVQVGTYIESNIPVYMVEFGAYVVGCLEEEITPF